MVKTSTAHIPWAYGQKLVLYWQILCNSCFVLSSQGSEPLPSVSERADRSNGYVKGSKAMADTQPKASEMVSIVHIELLFPHK